MSRRRRSSPAPIAAWPRCGARSRTRSWWRWGKVLHWRERNMDDLPSPYFREEHEALRAQIRRFVETEIKPHGLTWEEQGYVPREVLRRMGELGFLGIRYPAEYGGSEMDTLGSIGLAEELGRFTFGGAPVTVPVRTDQASGHLA